MGTFIAILICAIMGALVVQILRAEFLFWKVREVVTEARQVLQVIKGHWQTSDAAAERVVAEVQDVKRGAQRAAAVAAQARDAVAVAVEQVPERVIEKLKSSESVSDSSKLPAVRPVEGR